MDETSSSLRDEAATGANELLKVMNSPKSITKASTAVGGENHATPTSTPNSRRNPGSTSDVAVAPLKNVSPSRQALDFTGRFSDHKPTVSDAPTDVQFFRREMETQEKIIVALQRDNEALLFDKKAIAAEYKELQTNYEHLEAKHSLLLSAQQEAGSRSTLRLANDAVKIEKLQAEVQELQSALEEEKLRYLVLSQQKSAPPLSEEEQSVPDTPFHPPAASEIRAATRADAQATTLAADDINVKLREFQRSYDIQKATIDTLHGEVDRLEGEKKVIQEREQNLTDQLQRLSDRVRDTESAAHEKRESITDLISSCQGSSANAQRFKKQESRIRLLEAALVEKDEFTQRAMERLKGDTKEVCARYQETIADLQTRIREPKSDPELLHRVTALEKENLELRRSIGNSRGANASRVERVSVATNASPSRELDVLQRDGKGAVRTSEDGLVSKELSSRAQEELDEVRCDAAKYRELSSELEEELQKITQEFDERVREMKRTFAAQLQLVRSSHNEELERLEEAHCSEVQKLSRERKSSDENAFASKLLEIVTEKGYDASLIAISERLTYLEKRALQKEEEMSYELSEMKRLAEVEKRIQREKTELQLEQKNTQIKSFQRQLDELLASLAVLPSAS